MGQHVLVPVDGSAASEKALEHVLSEDPEAEITLLYVVTPASSFNYGGGDYFDAEGYQKHVEQQRADGNALLEEYRETAAARGVDVETVLENGKPARKILKRIEEHDVDHVVMGSRGRSGVGRVLFGSVAEAVTRRASIPVTIVR